MCVYVFEKEVTHTHTHTLAHIHSHLTQLRNLSAEISHSGLRRRYTFQSIKRQSISVLYGSTHTHTHTHILDNLENSTKRHL